MGETILVIGSGGREHALCWKLAQSTLVDRIYCAPGNGGTETTPKTQNMPILVDDFNALVAFAKANAVDFTVVGPDNPLADGIVDRFESEKLSIFGPNHQAAQLESSKVFAKRFMQTHQLSTAQFEVFDNRYAAYAFCETHAWARVIKVDGLALGKGVYVCDTLDECRLALDEIFEQNRFGVSGHHVVIEERLTGPEVSLMMLCDGKSLLPLTTAQDYKRRFEGNQGPNTGGMGAYSPVPLDRTLEERIQSQIIAPLEKALQSAPFVFKGVLYVGLLLQDDQPMILEFNARFGDPETQTVLPRLQSDLYPVLKSCTEGDLLSQRLTWTSDVSVCVTLTAESYPSVGSKGFSIRFPEALPENTVLFHAGTVCDQSGTILTQGGRVLNVVATSLDYEAARDTAYQVVQNIHFSDMAYRKDIAQEVVLCPSV